MELMTRELTTAERKEVFRRYMKYDFPYEELRPLKMIQKLVMKGEYYVYGVFEKEKIRSYACFWEEKESDILLFDYFAVIESMRNQGFGTESMKVLLEICSDKKGIILEVENPDTAESEEEKKIREKRIAFYQRCGWMMSDVRIWLYGVEYCMMYYGLESKDIREVIVGVMQRLYQNALPSAVYRRMFRVIQNNK